MVRFFIFIFLLIPSWCFAQDSTYVIDLLQRGKNALDAEEALDYYSDAYSLAKELRFENGINVSLEKLIALELQRKNTSGALRYLLENLDIAKKQKQPEKITQSALAIGEIYFAEKLFEVALPYYQLASSYREEDAIHQRLGDIHSELLRPDSAFHYYVKLGNWTKNGENTNSRINVFNKVVRAYLKAKEYDNALKFNQRILQIMSDADKPNAEIAIVYNNIGYNYNFLKNYEAAVSNFEEAVELTKNDDWNALAILYTNIGIAYFNLGLFQPSLSALSKAEGYLKKMEAVENTQINHLLSNVYLQSNDLFNAQKYNATAISHAQRGDNLSFLSDAYYTAAQVHVELNEFEVALDYYQKHLELRDKIEREEQLRQQDLMQEQIAKKKAEQEIRLLLINQEVKDLTIQQLETDKERQQLRLDNLKLESDRQEKELAILKQEEKVKDAEIKNQELLAQQAQQQLQITQQTLQSEQQDRALADLRQQQKLDQLELDQKEARLLEEQQKTALLEKDNEINQLELEKQKDFQNFAYGIGALGLLILGLILAGLIYSRRINRKLSHKNAEIESQKLEILKEQKKSEDLLLNILPAATAKELKEKGTATPRRYENTTVLFADFVNFTGISSRMAPEILVKELNYCFKAFDQIVDKYGLEKIKTIGDAYMCVGGLPQPNTNHPKNIVLASLEMMDFIQKRYEEKQAMNEPFWQMRIGLHSGPVVAGVVGTKKFVYDIWGDTVNTASRMESSSQPGKINLSGATYKLVRDFFETQYRGKIDARNKGKVDMY
ncbi:MAG: adenylate/guanylate cyclase domain-containing protein, partial [Bacteroidota bacterium]